MIGKHFEDGRLKAKTSFLKMGAEYNHSNFINELETSLEKGSGLSHIYNSIHQSFFNNWDNASHSGNMKYVVYHSGNGLLADIDFFLKEFKNSYFIQPIRNVYGYISSEKKKVNRQLIGRGKIGRRINFNDKMLKSFYSRYFESTLVNWLITVTRSVILKKKLGDRYIIYQHEDLVNNPETIMQEISKTIGLDYNDSLLFPTIGGVDWKGN